MRARARTRWRGATALTILKIKKMMIVPKRYRSWAEERTLFIEIGQVLKKRVENEKIDLDFFFHENTFSCLTEIIIGI